MSELPGKQPPCVFYIFEIALYALRLPYEAIGKLHVVVEPPLGGTFHFAGIYIETSAQALIYGIMPLQHLCHEKLLCRRAHCNENEIGTLGRNIVDKCGTLLRCA